MLKTETKKIEKEGKKPYQAPALIWLGEFATASGVCDAGAGAPSTPTYTCSAGPGDGNPTCEAGGYASTECISGAHQGAAYGPWRLP